VTLRFVANNAASGFKTRVLLTRGQPYPYLHLKVPKEIETVEVRKEARISTDTPVTVINKTLSSPAFPCRILNMSCSGCLIESTTKLAHQGETVNLTMKLKVADMEPLVTADAEVTYAKDEGDGKSVYGLNIRTIDEEDGVTLRAFVYQEILKSMHVL
jgi:c-di-GMP-binding flagellar brake protein YcgR